MKRTLNIRVADPAGNITIFVLDPVERKDYAPVAQALLALPELRGEQVAYVTGPDSMEMCGLEFCGNASRSFALMIAEERAKHTPSGAPAPERQTITVHVSGADEPLDVDVVPEISYTKVRMPLHERILSLEGLPGQLIDLGGIVHLVTEGIEPSEDFFLRARSRILEELGPPALGVMFCDGDHMTPVVYVADVDTTYNEGSCGSGSTAYAIARSHGRADGFYSYEILQPAGSLIASAEVRNGEVRNVWIEGPITLEDPVTVTVELPDPPKQKGFPTYEEFQDMVADELDALPEFFFHDLSGGVLVEESVMYSPYAKNNDLYAMGNYTVSPLGRQINIFYGSFRRAFGHLDRAALQREIRHVVRHEFRHHMEFLGGVHGKDSLEEEDRVQMKEYLSE